MFSWEQNAQITVVVVINILDDVNFLLIKLCLCDQLIVALTLPFKLTV